MFRLWAKSLRVRLTFWYIAVLAVVLGIYIVSVYVFQAWQLQRQIYHDEVQDMETVEGLLYFDPSGKLRLHDEYHSHPQSRLLVDRLMEVQSLTGAILYRNERLGTNSLGGPASEREGDGSFDERILTMPDASHVMRISHLHPVEGKKVLIRIAYSLSPAEDRQFRFLLILLLATPLTLVAAGFAGYRMAKTALMPLEDMASRAQQITAISLHDRLIIENPHDELGRLATVFNNLLARLEASFEQLQRFTSNAAHELRTPLAATRSVGEVGLQKSQSVDEYQNIIASMLEEVSRLTQTVDGLLMMARAESGQLILHREQVDIRQLIQEIFSLLEILAEEQEIELVLLAGPNLRIFTDRALLRTALINLIHNAIRYTYSQTSVTLSAQLIDLEHIQIVIQDEGPGLPDEIRETVFERFYRAESGRKETEGYGLGLSIARGAVQSLGGRVYFERARGTGATCIIELEVSSHA